MQRLMGSGFCSGTGGVVVLMGLAPDVKKPAWHVPGGLGGVGFIAYAINIDCYCLFDKKNLLMVSIIDTLHHDQSIVMQINANSRRCT